MAFPFRFNLSPLSPPPLSSSPSSLLSLPSPPTSPLLLSSLPPPPQAIGDGGQGWGNAILYIFLSPVIRERLIGEWCGKCVEKLEGLDHLGVAGGRASNQQGNSVQFRGSNGVKRKGERNNKPAAVSRRGVGLPSSSSSSSETVPLLSGKKAQGYNIREYNTTTTATMTEGITGTGTDGSVGH